VIQITTPDGRKIEQAAADSRSCADNFWRATRSRARSFPPAMSRRSIRWRRRSWTACSTLMATAFCNGSPSTELCRRRLTGVTTMTPIEAFQKLETEAGVAELCKMVSGGLIPSPLSKSDFMTVIQATAESVIKDEPGKPPLSKQQKFAKFIDRPSGREMLWTMKSARPRGRAARQPERNCGCSARMAVVSDPDDAAYLAAARRLEGGRAAPTREAMRPDYPTSASRPGEDENQGAVCGRTGYRRSIPGPWRLR
jgi:hypothetical protein